MDDVIHLDISASGPIRLETRLTIVRATAGTKGITITLPAPKDHPNAQVMVIKVDGAAGTVAVQPDPEKSKPIGLQLNVLWLVSDETGWAVIEDQKVDGRLAKIQREELEEIREWSLARNEAVRSFAEVQRKELEEIRASSRARNEAAEAKGKQPDPSQLMGLAFSGGGIRSATFNLGVLQGLAEQNLLHKFDYLSTVSGGGYIGSWLVAWIKRAGLKAVLDGLSPKVSSDRGVKPGDRREPEPIQWLRKYSNYLTPRAGFFSADTWAVIATYLRNLLLNQIILILAIAGALLLPRVITLISQDLDYLIRTWPMVTLIVVGAVLIFAAIAIARNMGAIEAPPTTDFPHWARQKAVVWQIVIPLLLGAWLASCWFWFLARDPRPMWADGIFSNERFPQLWVVSVAVAYTIPWAAGWIWGLFPKKNQAASKFPVRTDSTWVLPLAALIPGALGGLLLWRLALIFNSWRESAGGIAHALSWGPPLVFLTLTLVAVFHIGLMGTAFQDSRREWWSRLGGHLLTLSLSWAALFAVSLYSPLALMALGVWVGGTWTGGILGTGWILSTLGGVLGGKNERSGAKDSNRGLELAIQIAPYIFIAGILVIVSLGVHLTLGHFASPAKTAEAWSYIAHGKAKDAAAAQPEWKAVYSDPDMKIGYEKKTSPEKPELAQKHWKLMEMTQGWPLIGISLLVAFGGAMVLALRVDINEFSMHHLYRNRLTRCYLGASRIRPPRTPNPFTGFDFWDDYLLFKCTPSARLYGGEITYYGPYPIINAALNLVKTKDLAWQKRKAESFVFSPLYCGYHVQNQSNEIHKLDRCGYRRTVRYASGKDEGPWLGTAVAISGAAASPNMGYHSSAALAFLMTLFNVRLGWWIGNPRHRKCWTKAGPKSGLFYLIQELTGNSNDERGYVYLSDGGHFENLGIYELVRRRCRYIVACDGSADPGMTFEDLASAIEKCRTDFGVDIEIDTAPLKPPKDSRFGQWHCVVGRIHYGKVEAPEVPKPDSSDKPFVGTLVYLKTSLTGEEPADVQHYAAEHKEFPHETTGDQFFDESQFESYRELGYHVARTAFEVLGDPDELRLKNPEQLFLEMRQQWTPPSKASQRSFTKLTATVGRIYEILRTRSELEFLHEQIYPEWPAMMENSPRPPRLWLPSDPEKLRAGFYLCNEVIQLMEDVYTDLQLEEEFEHPDNRGWMNLFKHWSWSGMFQVTYAICASTYGARFQTFCRRHLGLLAGKVGRPLPIASARDVLRNAAPGAPAPPAPVELNFLEWELLWDFASRNKPADDDTGYDAYAFPIQVDHPADPNEFRSYVFGFCVVRTNLEGIREICFFRVQDHLRDMGLGREALSKLLKLFQEENAPDVRFVDLKPPEAHGVKVQPEDQLRFRRIFNSVYRDVWAKYPIP